MSYNQREAELGLDSNSIISRAWVLICGATFSNHGNLSVLTEERFLEEERAVEKWQIIWKILSTPALSSNCLLDISMCIWYLSFKSNRSENQAHYRLHLPGQPSPGNWYPGYSVVTLLRCSGGVLPHHPPPLSVFALFFQPSCCCSVSQPHLGASPGSLMWAGITTYEQKCLSLYLCIQQRSARMFSETRALIVSLSSNYWLSAYEFEQTLGDSEEQESLLCYSSWGHKELDTTWWLNSKTSWLVTELPHSPVRTSQPGFQGPPWSGTNLPFQPHLVPITSLMWNFWDHGQDFPMASLTLSSFYFVPVDSVPETPSPTSQNLCSSPRSNEFSPQKLSHSILLVPHPSDSSIPCTMSQSFKFKTFSPFRWQALFDEGPSSTDHHSSMWFHCLEVSSLKWTTQKWRHAQLVLSRGYLGKWT